MQEVIGLCYIFIYHPFHLATQRMYNEVPSMPYLAYEDEGNERSEAGLQGR